MAKLRQMACEKTSASTSRIDAARNAALADANSARRQNATCPGEQSSGWRSRIRKTRPKGLWDKTGTSVSATAPLATPASERNFRRVSMPVTLPPPHHLSTHLHQLNQRAGFLLSAPPPMAYPFVRETRRYRGFYASSLPHREPRRHPCGVLCAGSRHGRPSASGRGRGANHPCRLAFHPPTSSRPPRHHRNPHGLGKRGNGGIRPSGSDAVSLRPRPFHGPGGRTIGSRGPG